MAKKATIRTRRRGSTYSYSFDAGKNPTTGKRRAIEKGGYATEQEAYDAGVAAYADWKSGNIGITSERIKLRDYLAAWLENVMRPNVTRGTYHNYSSVIRVRINPILGDIYVQDLRPRDVDTWMKRLAERGFPKDHFPFPSPSCPSHSNTQSIRQSSSPAIRAPISVFPDQHLQKL